MAVPAGTIAEVLAWVGDDPARAQQALDAELAGQNRSTLISQLEAIASQEEPVSEEPITEAPEETAEEAPGPKPPTEIAVTPGPGTIISAIMVRDADVVVPDGADITPEEPAEGEEPAPITADQVEFAQVASSSAGLVLAFNGTAYVLNPQQVTSLKFVADRAVAGMSL